MSLLKKIVIGLGAIVAISGTIYAASHLATKQINQNLTTDQRCLQIPQAVNYTIYINNDAASPAHVTARQCDSLTIINQDDKIQEIAFGLHEDHVPYDNVTEKTLLKDQSLTVTLIQIGNFRLHDHIRDRVQATFTVNRR